MFANIVALVRKWSGASTMATQPLSPIKQLAYTHIHLHMGFDSIPHFIKLDGAALLMLIAGEPKQSVLLWAGRIWKHLIVGVGSSLRWHTAIQGHGQALLGGSALR